MYNKKMKIFKNDKKIFFVLRFNRIAVACKNCVGQLKPLLSVVADYLSKLSLEYALQPHLVPRSPEKVPPSLKRPCH